MVSIKTEIMKTAVEWLEDELHAFIHPEHGKDFLPILKKAKEMEKQQITDAYKADLYPCSDEDAEDYYNETFKSE